MRTPEARDTDMPSRDGGTEAPMGTRTTANTTNAKGTASPLSSTVCAGMLTRRLALAFAAALALALALALAGCGPASSAGGLAGGSAQGITVSASNEVKVVPDKARMSVSVVTEAKEAKDCQSQNAETVNAVIAALQGLGVEETSIQTSYSDLSPRYGQLKEEIAASSKDDEDENASVAYDEWTITGYEMTTSLSVSDLDIDNVGTAVQACVAAGANGADGIEYYASNYDEVYNAALGRALETARGKADGIAAASDVKVGKVLNVVEGYQDTSARYTYANTMDFEESADAGAGVAAKTMPGQIGITAQVTVTYAIA